MGDLQQQMSKTLLVELKELEKEGIVIKYRGSRRRFKVILLTLAGDNLGLNQLGALCTCFSGNNPCRMCNVTARNLKGKYELPVQGLKTAEVYDQIISRGDAEEMVDWGIRAPCAFNELQYLVF
uniref:Uncharacterized protein n=1 Tax=Panagrolaimus superbus TaxID=310955 RepID=A0A914YAZ1_9BILA